MSNYHFKGRATGLDPEGYYVTDWDRAKNISVLAETKEQATEKAFVLLGDHPRYARRSTPYRNGFNGWTLIWDSIEEENA